jgi:hypothetical protein
VEECAAKGIGEHYIVDENDYFFEEFMVSDWLW